MRKVTLHNVRDTRDNREYSIVIVDERKAKWFVPIEEEQGNEYRGHSEISGVGIPED